MADSQRPLILVTNDDGITAPGIRTLIKLMKTLGEVVVVAPDSPQSGMGHAITLHDPLRVHREHIDPEVAMEYSTSGTPVDCVKLAVHELLDRSPDLIVSGINHGSNASVNVIYSGTMSAAVEGALQGIPSIGFSSLDYSWETDFGPAEGYILDIARKVLDQGMPDDICLNVNIPKPNGTPYAGLKVGRQARARWKEEFIKRQDQSGKPYYWMAGNFQDLDAMPDDTDFHALNHHYISVVPVQFDLTAHHTLSQLHQILDA